MSQVISDFGLSEQLERHLTKYSLLGGSRFARRRSSPACCLESAAETDGGSLAERERVIKRAIAQSQKVLGRDHMEGLRESVTNYSLDHLNIAGRFTPQQIITALRKRPKGSLCFWGIPGAGKTQLAEYIAVRARSADTDALGFGSTLQVAGWRPSEQIAAMFTEG